MIFEDLPPKKTTLTLDIIDIDFDLHTLFSTEEEGEFLGFGNPIENLTISPNEPGPRSGSNEEENELLSLETSVNLSSIFLSENSMNTTFFGF